MFSQNFLSDYARPYAESIYAEMIAGQKAKENALQQEKETNLRKQQELEEEKRQLLINEVERFESQCL